MPNHCLIDDMCVAEGAHHPDDACWVCDPAINTTGYEYSTSEECDVVCRTDDHCDDGYECLNNECVPLQECRAKTDCPNGYECKGGLCQKQVTLPSPLLKCKADSECKEGACIDGRCMAVKVEGGGVSCSVSVPAERSLDGRLAATLVAVLGLLAGWARRRLGRDDSGC